MDQIDEIKERICNEISKTKRIISDYKELIKPIAPDDAIGRISRMDAINNKSVTEAALRQAEKKLEGLYFMEKSLGSKEFGLCQKCKQKIPFQRLLFMPQSRFCVYCTN